MWHFQCVESGEYPDGVGLDKADKRKVVTGLMGSRGVGGGELFGKDLR